MERTKRWSPVTNRRCFRRHGCLEGVREDDVLVLHCELNRELQEPDERHSERSRVPERDRKVPT